MSGLETLFSNQYRIARQRDTALLPTPKFHDPQMTREEAHTLPWEAFVEKMNPLAVAHSQDSNTSYVVTSKYVSWSPEDVNIYVGNPDKRILELDDMTDSEGEQLFDIYQELIDGILVDKPAVHVSIGFNPTDFSIAHHSVPQLHSHIYVPVSDLRQTVPTKEMRKFYKLAFVEPFSPVAHDLIKHYLNHQNLQTLDAASCQEGLGFTSFDFDRSEFKNAYGDVRNLYSYLKRCYNDIANIYTDGVSDEATGKFIPVEETQRLERLERFMEETPVQFGSESGRVLSYLAHNLVPAVPRGDDPRELDEPGHIHITRGFSGAFTFRFAADDEQGHFDIAPRIVTTSAVAKTLYGDDRPTEIIKETLLATDEQQTTMQNYKNTVTSIMNNNNE